MVLGFKYKSTRKAYNCIRVVYLTKSPLRKKAEKPGVTSLDTGILALRFTAINRKFSTSMLKIINVPIR